MACPKGCGACTQNGLCSTCLPGWIKNKKGRCIAKGSDNCDECECPSAALFDVLWIAAELLLLCHHHRHLCSLLDDGHGNEE